jgi:hypothetical protein
VTRGSAFYLWYFKTAGLPPAPLGVTDEPAPDDVVGIQSVPIGSRGAARYAEMISHGAAEINYLLDRYLTFEKKLRPWTRDWP